MHNIKVGGKQNVVPLEIKLKINFLEIITEDSMHFQDPIDNIHFYS